MRCLGVVTARGGSKGVPGKNLRPLAGRPLLQWTLDVARVVPRLTTVVVTTDAEEIRDLALALGAEAPFLRPDELATDDAQQEDAILHAMDWYEEHERAYDLVCLLEPTSPFRTARSLDAGFELLAARADADAVFSVTHCDHAHLYCRPLPADGFLREWVPDELRWANRQELPVLHRPVSAVVLSRWSAFRRERSFLHDGTLSVVVDELEAVEIDTELDFLLAEAVASRTRDAP